MNEIDFNKWYTAKELSVRLNINKSLIYYYANNNKLKVDKSSRPNKFKITPLFFNEVISRQTFKTIVIENSEIQNKKEKISILLYLKLTWQKLIDDPNRYSIIKWLGVIGAIASIIAIILPFSKEIKTTSNPSEQINKYMSNLLEYNVYEDSLFYDERVQQIRNAVINLAGLYEIAL